MALMHYKGTYLTFKAWRQVFDTNFHCGLRRNGRCVGYSCHDGYFNYVLLFAPDEHGRATLYPNLTPREEDTLLKAYGIDKAGIRRAADPYEPNRDLWDNLVGRVLLLTQ